MVATRPEPEPVNPFAAPQHGPTGTVPLTVVWLRVVAVIAAASGFVYDGYCTLMQWDDELVVPMVAAGATLAVVVVLLKGPLRREARLLLSHFDLWVPLLLFIGYSGWVCVAANALMSPWRWRQEETLVAIMILAVLGFVSGWTVRMAIQVVDEGRCNALDVAAFALRWVPRVGFAMMAMWFAMFLCAGLALKVGSFGGADCGRWLTTAVVVAINAMTMALLPLVAVGREPLWSEARLAWTIAWKEMPRWWWLILAHLAVVGVMTWTGWAPPRFGSRLPIHPAWVGGLYVYSGWVIDVMPIPFYGPRTMLTMSMTALCIGALEIAVMLRVVADLRRHDHRRGLEFMRHADELKRTSATPMPAGETATP